MLYIPFSPLHSGNLLAGIQGFNKSNLKKADDEEDEPPSSGGAPAGGLLAGIQGFNKGGLKSAAAENPAKRPSSNKIEKPANMYDQLTAAMGAIRANVKQDDDSEGSDWSDA